MTEDAFHDIAAALHRLRRAFAKHDLKPPVALELANRRDGERLTMSIPRDMLVAVPQADRADPEIVMNLVGFEIRYPAQFRSVQGGGYVIE